MKLNYELSPDNIELLGLRPQEEIYYCLPMDIDEEGNLRENSYFVMTNQRILLLKEGNLGAAYEIQDYDCVKAEPMVGCGIIYLEREEIELLLGRYSAKHLTRYSYMNRGMEILKNVLRIMNSFGVSQ